jgi:hypothetical protein
LLVVDLAKIENRSLHRFVGSDTMDFYDTEVALLFAVVFLRLLPRRNMLTGDSQKVAGQGRHLVPTLPFFQTGRMKTDAFTAKLRAKNAENPPQRVKLD